MVSAGLTGTSVVSVGLTDSSVVSAGLIGSSVVVTTGVGSGRIGSGISGSTNPALLSREVLNSCK